MFKVVAKEIVLELGAHGVGGAVFVLTNAKEWVWWNFVAWTVLILAGLELLARIALLVGPLLTSKRITPRGKHLETLLLQDKRK